MLIRKPRGWALPEAAATPEDRFHGRRLLLKGLAAGPMLLAGAPRLARAAAEDVDPTADLYPVARNPRYQLDDRLPELTDEGIATRFNNFYEFGLHKQIAEAAQALQIRPWTVTFDGMVEKEQTLEVDDLIRRVPLEERIYRLRCVETWSMVVPWSGFPLAALVDLARPLGGATYLRMESFLDPGMAPGQEQTSYPWPYVEGLTMAEATNELAFIATGLYGKPLPRQSGAPLRLVVPWKYGFKSIKSIVRFTFTDQRPVGFWEQIQGGEYGFWANVNPDVPHPRWSQATEAPLGGPGKVSTVLFNDYQQFVADLYQGLEHEELYK